MKRYLIITTVLAVLLVAAFTGGAWAGEEGLTLEGLAKSLAALTERTDSHEERINALEEFVSAAPPPTALPMPSPTPPLPEQASVEELAAYLVDRDAAYEGGCESRMPFGNRSDAIGQTAHMLRMKTARCKHRSVRETAEIVDRHAIALEEAGVTAEALSWADHRSFFRFRGLSNANSSEMYTCRQLLDRLTETWIAEYKASLE